MDHGDERSRAEEEPCLGRKKGRTMDCTFQQQESMPVSSFKCSIYGRRRKRSRRLSTAIGRDICFILKVGAVSQC